MSQQPSKGKAKATGRRRESDSDSGSSAYFSASEETEAAGGDNHHELVDQHLKSLIMGKLDEIKEQLGVELRGELSETKTQIHQDVKQEVLAEIPSEVLVLDKMTQGIKELVLSEVTDALEKDITEKIIKNISAQMERELDVVIDDELRRLRDEDPQRQRPDLSSTSVLLCSLELKAKHMHNRLKEEANKALESARKAQENATLSRAISLALKQEHPGDTAESSQASLSSYYNVRVSEREIASKHSAFFSFSPIFIQVFFPSSKTIPSPKTSNSSSIYGHSVINNRISFS
ncbi:hypothetical protein F4809DRAFT_556656 [Biscogniauxia mediterranea]|nr:hypothetical protein F4809DRAFT_556656 [Biscogniauxia mediterranea]